jgi:hypothetical protein
MPQPGARSKSGRYPLVRMERDWLHPRALPQAVAAAYGNVWRSIPVYMRAEKK